MTHVIALDAGQSNQGTFEHITPAVYYDNILLNTTGCQSTSNILLLVLGQSIHGKLEGTR